jgi:PAS domain S-box-containing protein
MRREEHASRDSEQRLRIAARAAKLGLFEWDSREDRAVWQNERTYEIFGRSLADGPLSLREFEAGYLHSDDLDELQRALREASQQGGAFHLVCRIHRESAAEQRWIECTGEWHDGRLIGVVADITERQLAARSLRAGDDMFRHLVEHSPFGVYVIDADFRLIQVSAGAQKVFENVRPLLGRDFDEVMHIIWPEPFASEAVDRFRHTLATGEAYKGPRTIEQRRDLHVVESYDWKIERVQLPDGRFGVVCHFYDLSERLAYEQALRDREAELRRSEGRFRQLANAMPQLVWMANADGIPTYYNSQVTRYDGIQARADGLWSWSPAVHPEDLSTTEQAWQHAVAHRSIYECQHRIRMADGSFRWHLSRARYVGVGQWFGTATDIHDLKQTQERLRESEQQLQRLNHELSEANQRKDEFLAMLGHELRNPLAAIRTATQLMKLVDPDDNRLSWTQGVLERQSTHMTRLIDGLLEVSRIARGKIRLDRETLDLREVLAILVQDRVSQIEGRGLVLQQDFSPEPLWVLADPVRLAQIFDNLLSNAMKFTRKPGRISVTLHEHDGAAVVRVRDTGVGIEPAMLERVFEPFQQETQEIHRGAGGLGLGLALAKGLVELHDGSIRARSAGRGTGTEFEVRLPLSAPAHVAPPAEPAASPEARRVLVVEDNLDAGQTLRTLLEMLGHDATLVESGAAALEFLQARGADVVLCDLGLPGMSGYEVARAVRERASLQQTRLVALTGYGQPEDRKRTADAGFDEHLTKPVDVAELTAVLE